MVWKVLKKAIAILSSKFKRPDSILQARSQFLPGAIAIEETPASPVSRMIIKAIVLLFIITVAWACIGKIDIVAIAQGKIVPGDRVKTIQSMVIGEIKTIHIREGDEVRAGAGYVVLLYC